MATSGVGPLPTGGIPTADAAAAACADGAVVPAHQTSGCACGAGCACADAGARRREVRRVTLPIFGLGCGGAGATTVERALEKTPGVVRAYVNPATEMAYVEFDGCVCGTEALKAAVRRAGLRAGHPCYR